MSALKLLVAFRKQPSLATHAQRAALLEAREARAFVREMNRLNKQGRKAEKSGGFFNSLRPGGATKA